MKHKHILACICYMSCMASCQSESDNLLNQTAELSMSIVANIGDTPSITGRYIGSDLKNAEFTTGDSIGIFINDLPLTRWDYVNISWTPKEKTYWPDKENSHSFKAFYPYSEAINYENIPMPSLLGQDGTLTKLPQHDFLVAETSQEYGDNGIVYFQGEGKSFRHISSLVELTIHNTEDLATATLNKISLSGTNIVSPTNYSFTDGVSLNTNENSDLLEITPNKSMTEGNAIYYLIVNEKLDTSSIVTLTIEYTVNNKVYTAVHSNFSGNQFQGGMQNSFAITIRNRTLHIYGSEISPWTQDNELEDIIIDSQEKE